MIEIVENIENVNIDVVEISTPISIEITENNLTTVLNIQQINNNLSFEITENTTIVNIEVTENQGGNTNSYYPSGW
jgi:signal recognition particle receptor subunit beta